MKKKIKIKINGKINRINDKTKLSDLVKNLKKINLKLNDKIEIVHFIGGG